MRTAAVFSGLVIMAMASGCDQSRPQGDSRPRAAASPVDLLSEAWQGYAISYSGYREGQSPETGTYPSQEQVAEDLRILARNWQLIRIYGADQHGEDVLEVIRREKLGLKVMLGIWLGNEPEAADANARQIAKSIRLANAYDDIVVAVNVGNEVLIEWTAHPVREEKVIRYVRQVKQAIRQPVTVADNYVWWRDYGAALAREVDFITIHTYPLWERKDIDQGLAYTIKNYESVKAAHPGKKIVIGEAGWASYTKGNLHVPRGGDEQKQQRYYEELTGWARQNNVTVFVFSAFDEPWKGTGTEGHWGLFTVDRKAKPVMQRLYPDLMPARPTSPSYSDRPDAPAGPDLSAALRPDFAKALVNATTNPLGPGLSSAEEASIDGAEGGTVLRLVFNASDWGGVYFLFDKHDLGDRGKIVLKVKLPDSVASLELKLEGPESKSHTVDLIEFMPDRGAPGWSTVEVPLSAFKGIDPAQLMIIGIWNPTDKAGKPVACEILVDDLHFE